MTDRTWSEEPGTAGYQPVRWEARVLVPEPGEAAPLDMAPLHRWYSPGRGDHFTTTDRAWHGGPGQRREPDYQWRALEGYVFDSARAGTVPLYAWAGSGKHTLTTDWTWTGPQRVRGLPRRRAVPNTRFDRIEGYAYPSGNITSEVDPDVLGFGSQRPQPDVNVLGVIVDLADLPADVDASDMDRLLFGRRYRGAARNLVPLHTWRSVLRNDFLTTTRAEWIGDRAAFPRRDPDYRFFRTEGFGFDPAAGPAPAGTVMLRRVTHLATGAIRVTSDPIQPVTSPPPGDEPRPAPRIQSVDLAQVFDPARPQPDGTLALHRWHSTGRDDHFTTTDPAWRGRRGASRDGYQWQALEGYVFPQAFPGSVPLCAWWSRALTRHDLQTKGPRSVSHRAPEYALLRAEGQILSPRMRRASPPGKPLWTWWNIEHGGHLTTTDPQWEGQPGDQQDGYRFVAFEGWVLSREQAGTVPLRRYVSPDGRRHVTTCDPHLFSRAGLPTWKQESVEGWVVGPTTGPDDLPAQYRNVSGGRFRINRAGLVRVTVPWTVADVRRIGTLPPDETDAEIARFRRDVVGTSAGPAGAVYRGLATNGVVRPQDLTVVAIIPSYDAVTAGGQYQGIVPINAPRRWPRLEPRYLAVNEFGDINLVAHELLHSIGFAQHLYGPKYALNGGATFFARSNRAPGPGALQLDPWHRMKAGWLKPRVIQMNHPGDNVRMGRGFDHVLVFWHPGRRPRLEYFFVEYRAPGYGGPSWFDRSIGSSGLMIWYTQATMADVGITEKRARPPHLVTFPWPPPFDGHSEPGTMYAHYVVAPSGRAGQKRIWTPGVTHRTRSTSQVARLWRGDGEPTGMIFRLGGTPARPWLQWESRRDGFVPRLDRILEAPPARVSGSMRLEGVFPVDGVTVRLQAPDGSASDHATGRAPATNPRVAQLLAPAAPPGQYLVRVRGRAEPRNLSNTLVWERS